MILKDALDAISITREQLIDIGLLIGTDFNEGISGIGPKKALKNILDNKNIEGVIKQGKIKIDFPYEEIREIFQILLILLCHSKSILYILHRENLNAHTKNGTFLSLKMSYRDT